MKLISSQPSEQMSIEDIYLKFAEKYDHVFIEQMGESGVFIYKSLGRKDWRDIIESESIDDCQKEEVICETCVLYPENYNFADCPEAGLPTMLSKTIIEKSFLSDAEKLTNLIRHFRDELAVDLNKQISCVIHEAFSEFTIEEIENWDILKTAEYMSRAEFILHSLRGVPLNPVEYSTDDIQKEQPIEQKPAPVPQKTPSVQKQPARSQISKEKLEELKRIAPGINWEADLGKFGQDGLRHKDVDTRRASSIPVDGSEDGQEAIPEALRNRFKVITK